MVVAGMEPPTQMVPLVVQVVVEVVIPSQLAALELRAQYKEMMAVMVQHHLKQEAVVAQVQ